MKQLKFFANKRGQLTIFIILGILMLISSAMLIFIKEKVSSTQTFEDLIGTAPMEVQPVKEFVEKCMYDIGKQAITLIGENGGWINIDKSAVQIKKNDPTMSEGIELVEGTGVVVPYWLFMSADNECQGNCMYDTSLIPELNKQDVDDLSIENQISTYVEEHLNDCIDGFKNFESISMDVNQEKEPLADTVINHKEVILKLKYPISIFQSNTNTTMDYFIQKFDVQLYYAYVLARLITLQERDNMFLEQSFANLVTEFGGRDSFMPPMYGGTDFGANSKKTTWELSSVKEHVTNILYPYTSNFKVSNTQASSRIVEDEDETQWDYIINKMNYYVLLDFDYPLDLDVDFSYMPSWPIYLDIQPSKGGVIEPEDGGTEFLEYIGLGITKYTFTYDVSYPVLVRVHDDKAFNNEGFQFYFGLESNVRNNQGVMADNSDNYIESSDGEIGLLCSDERKRTGNITVKAIDFVTKEPIPNTEVLSSFRRTDCKEGTTNEEGIHTGVFQSGIGYLTLKHDGYLSSNDLYVFGINKTDEKEVELYPGKELVVTLHKILYTKNSSMGPWTLGEEELLSEDEPGRTGMITFTRVKDTDSQKDYEVNIMFSEDFTPQNVKLYPGKYELSMMYMDSNLYNVPATIRCGDDDDDCVTIPAFNSSLTIANELFDEPYLLELYPDMIYDKTKIDLNMLVPDFYNPRIILQPESQSLLEEISDIYKMYYPILAPEIK